MIYLHVADDFLCVHVASMHTPLHTGLLWYSELSLKQSSKCSTLTYSLYELEVGTDEVRMKTAETMWFCSALGLTIRDGIQSLDIRGGAWSRTVAPLR